MQPTGTKPPLSMGTLAKFARRRSHLVYIAENYVTERKRFVRALNSVEQRIRDYFDDLEVSGRIHYIQSRIKSLDSIQIKYEEYSDRFKNVFEDMHDIAGIRIVCINPDYVDEAKMAIKILFNQDPIKDELVQIKDTGYEAWHLIYEVKPLVNGMARKTKVEIQIRTIGQDYFATMSHKYAYKLSTDMRPPDWDKRMLELSRRIEEIDLEIKNIGDEWVKKHIEKAKGSLAPKAIKSIAKEKLALDLLEDDPFNIYRIIYPMGVKEVSQITKVIENKLILEKIYAFLEKHKRFGTTAKDKFLLIALFSDIDTNDYDGVLKDLEGLK